MQKNETIHDILAQREEFLVIGLTGRMGSGCSKVAEVLATPYEKMNFPHPKPPMGMRSLTEEERTIRIIAEYADAHWLKFDILQVGAIIATFILNDDSRFINDLSSCAQEKDCEKHRIQFRKLLLKNFYCQLVELGQECGLLEKDEKKEYYIREITDERERKEAEKDGFPDAYTNLFEKVFVRKFEEKHYQENMGRELEALGDFIKKLVPKDTYIQSCFDAFLVGLFATEQLEGHWDRISENMNYLYRQVLLDHPKVHRRKYLECVDELLVLFSFHRLQKMFWEVLQEEESVPKALWDRLEKINEHIEPTMSESFNVPQIEKFVFVKYITSWFGKTVRDYTTETVGRDAYARLFQRYGQMIRYYGCIKPYTKNRAKKQEPTAKPQIKNSDGQNADIFAIPRKINEHIKILRHPFRSTDQRPVRIVVDSIKNIFEAVYLRYRYSAFYLWAITTDSGVRESRLRNKHLTDIQVRMMDWNEYPDKGSEVIAEVDKVVKENSLVLDDASQQDKIRKILTDKLPEAKVNFYLDSLTTKTAGKKQQAYYRDNEVFNKIRRGFFLNNTYPFYTQDIDSCVCNADVYLFNNATGTTDTENNRKLLEAVVRNVSLVMYPCLVRPTPIERCMQIAFSAKVNSGCLSRQVGAVVTDAQFNILAIGWNDVPCGEVPCAYKNLNDILAGADQDAYSEYELHDDDFRKRLMEYKNPGKHLAGLPFSYCFKNVHKDVKDPMRSRAMHAEEKALALCGREAEGGYLFTTSSPCEMCSKNAKNHKIKKVYYLEAYPGISQAQYTNSGDKSNRAELILFSGAVGRAYMQMYTPLLPHKDVLEYLGIKRVKR